MYEKYGMSTGQENEKQFKLPPPEFKSTQKHIAE
jgi:hypothetical protein